MVWRLFDLIDESIFYSFDLTRSICLRESVGFTFTIISIWIEVFYYNVKTTITVDNTSEVGTNAQAIITV